MDTQVNRALAAMQLAKQQKQPEPSASKPPVTHLFDSQTQSSQDGLTKEPAPKPQTTKTAYLNKSTQVVSTPVQTKETTPKFTRVDISIAGTPHRINCPSDEVENVNRTADRLNDNLRQIRRGTSNKSPSNEELLVLHCLELYDEIAELKKWRQNELINSERASALLDKILKDAKTIL